MSRGSFLLDKKNSLHMCISHREMGRRFQRIRWPQSCMTLSFWSRESNSAACL